MKVTFFSTMEGFPWGGSEELWYQTALLAIECKHEVQICVLEWESSNKKLKEIKIKGANLVYRPRISHSIISRIKRKIKPSSIPGYIKELRDYAADYILISQGATFDFFHNELFYNYIQNSKKPFSIISQFNFESGAILSESIKLKVKNSRPWSKFYFVAERNLKAAQRQYGGDINNSCLIDNPFNINHVEIAKWPETSTIMLACVARLDCNFKGQDVLLEALSSNEFKDIDYQLHFVGTGPHQSHLEQLIKYYELEKNVKFIGHYDDIDELWLNYHFLILPSLAEGTPLSLQEAMLKGRAALVNNVGDCSKLIINGTTGILCEGPSKQSLSSGLHELFKLTNNELQEMGKNSFHHAKSTINFDSPQVLLDDLIRTL